MSRTESIFGQYTAGVLTQTHGELVGVATAGGTAFTDVMAVIDRFLLAPTADGEPLIEYEYTAKVAKQDVPSVTVGVTAFRVKRRSDSTASTNMLVTHIVDQVGGMWHLRIR